MQRRRALAALSAACAAVAVPLCLLVGWRAPGWWAVPLLGGAAGCADLISVSLAVGRQRWRLAPAQVLVAAALVVAPGSWVVLAAAAATALAAQLRRLPRRHAFFEVARTGVAAALGTAVVLVTRDLLGLGSGGDAVRLDRLPASAGPPLIALAGGAAGVLVLVGCAHLLACAAAAVTARRSLWRLVRAGASFGVAEPLSSAGAGLLAGWLALAAPLGLVALIVPVTLLWSVHQQQRRRELEVALYAELVRSQELVSGRSVDVAAQVVLTALARLLGGADVELLLRHPAGPVRYLGDEYGVHSRTPAAGAAFDAQWALHALGADRVVSGSSAGRPYLAATVGAAGGIGVLVAWRTAGSPEFGRSDLLGVDALVAQATAWLAVRELTDPGQDLAVLEPSVRPAMSALRESAHRLSRLSQRLDGANPVGSIVEELYVTEQAVAALLGAAATASTSRSAADQPGEAAESALPDPQSGTAQDWTTTGTLP